MTWTQEAVSDLKRLFAESRTFNQIAEVMRLSRNAVIGKAHRLGLRYSPQEQAERRGGGNRVGRPRTKDRTASKPRGNRGRISESERVERMREAIDAVPNEIRDLPSDESPFACELADLTPETCRWPLNSGEGGYLFCGAKTFGQPPFGKKPYCAKHCLLAYRPVASREPYVGKAE